MWAIKNFVCGPFAAVTFGARPYPGALKQTANGHAARSLQTLQYLQYLQYLQTLQTLQCSTLVGGRVDYVHKGRSLASHGAFCLV